MNNLHIITLYKLHNKLSCQSCLLRSLCLARRACRASEARRVEPVERVELVVSSVSSRAVQQARHSQNAWARYVERVESCRVETWRAKWNLGLNYTCLPSCGRCILVACHLRNTGKNDNNSIVNETWDIFISSSYIAFCTALCWPIQHFSS